MNSNIELLDFLTFSYFGYTYSEIQEIAKTEDGIKKIAIICAKRAYLDLSRTLTYAKATDSDKMEEDKAEQTNNSFKENICACLGERIAGFLNIPDAEEFEKWHNKVCSCITACGEVSPLLKIRKTKTHSHNSERFYYGQAQKWVNMTLKYMWLLDVNGMDKIKKDLHVPIDSYILKAAASVGDDDEYSLIKDLKEDDPDRKKLIKNKGTTWSTLSKEQYSNTSDENASSNTGDGIQDILKRQIGNRKWDCVDSPIDWEARAWIAQARLERKKKTTR